MIGDFICTQAIFAVPEHPVDGSRIGRECRLKRGTGND
jgi:hypothetical protein